MVAVTEFFVENTIKVALNLQNLILYIQLKNLLVELMDKILDIAKG